MNIGKTFKVLADAELIELTKRIKESAVNHEENLVNFIPRIVVELAYNEIQLAQSNKAKWHLSSQESPG